MDHAAVAGKSIANKSVDEQFQLAGSILVEAGLTAVPTQGLMKYSGTVHLAGSNRPTTCSVLVGLRSHTKYLTPDISRRVATGFRIEVVMESTVASNWMIAPALCRGQWIINLAQKFRGNRRQPTAEALYPGHQIWASKHSDDAQVFSNDDVRAALSELLIGGASVDSASDSSGRATNHTLAWKQRALGLMLSENNSSLTVESVHAWTRVLATIVDACESTTAPPSEMRIR